MKLVRKIKGVLERDHVIRNVQIRPSCIKNLTKIIDSKRFLFCASVQSVQFAKSLFKISKNKIEKKLKCSRTNQRFSINPWCAPCIYLLGMK